MPRHKKPGERAFAPRTSPDERLLFFVNDEHKPGGQGGPTSRQGGEILSFSPVSCSLTLPLHVDHRRNISGGGQANVQLWLIQGQDLFELEASR